MNSKKAFHVFKKTFRWLIYIVVGLLVILLIFVEGFDRYISTEKGTRWLFNDIPYKETLKINFTQSGVRYLTIGDTTKTPLVLIHGAPGSAFDWKAFSKRKRIYDKYRLIIVERPGYGGTKPRSVEKSIKVQAERIIEVLEQEVDSAVVLGHSYGGPVAIAMAALKPSKIIEVIGVSGQYDPDNEVTMKISYFIKYKIFKYLLPRWIWVSNEEKLSHPAAQRQILPLYNQVNVPTILVHGTADALVPYENSTFLMKFLANKGQLVTWEGYDHPVHMTATDALVDFVLDYSKIPPPLKQ